MSSSLPAAHVGSFQALIDGSHTSHALCGFVISGGVVGATSPFIPLGHSVISFVPTLGKLSRPVLIAHPSACDPCVIAPPIFPVFRVSRAPLIDGVVGFGTH